MNNSLLIFKTHLSTLFWCWLSTLNIVRNLPSYRLIWKLWYSWLIRDNSFRLCWCVWGTSMLISIVFAHEPEWNFFVFFLFFFLPGGDEMDECFEMIFLLSNWPFTAETEAEECALYCVGNLSNFFFPFSTRALFKSSHITDRNDNLWCGKSVELEIFFSNEIARAQLNANKKSFNDSEMKIDDDSL